MTINHSRSIKKEARVGFSLCSLSHNLFPFLSASTENNLLWKNRKKILFETFLVFWAQKFHVIMFGFRFKNVERKSEKAESELKVISFNASEIYELETNKIPLKTWSKPSNECKLVLSRSGKYKTLWPNLLNPLIPKKWYWFVSLLKKTLLLNQKLDFIFPKSQSIVSFAEGPWNIEISFCSFYRSLVCPKEPLRSQ